MLCASSLCSFRSQSCRTSETVRIFLVGYQPESFLRPFCFGQPSNCRLCFDDGKMVKNEQEQRERKGEDVPSFFQRPFWGGTSSLLYPRPEPEVIFPMSWSDALMPTRYGLPHGYHMDDKTISPRCCRYSVYLHHLVRLLALTRRVCSYP